MPVRVERVVHYFDAGHFAGGPIELRHCRGHVVVAGVGSRCGDQRQRGGAQLREVLLQLVVDLRGIASPRPRSRRRSGCAVGSSPKHGRKQRSSQQPNTSLRCFRRLALRRIMNRWMSISPHLPRNLRGCERTAAC